MNSEVPYFTNQLPFSHLAHLRQFQRVALPAAGGERLAHKTDKAKGHDKASLTIDRAGEQSTVPPPISAHEHWVI